MAYNGHLLSGYDTQPSIPVQPHKRTFKEWFLGVPAESPVSRQIREDHERATLAAHAMRHIAVLSALEARAMDIAPQSAEQYRQIIDTYTQKAADKVRKW